MPDIFNAESSNALNSVPQTPATSARQPLVDSAVAGLPTQSSWMFSSFCPVPENIAFEVQHQDEKILLVLRQHFIVNVGWIFLAFVLALLPGLLSFVSFLNFLPVNFRNVAFISWYLMIFGFSLERFLTWFFSVYIVTAERIIDVDFFSLTFKKISEAQISKIEDITSLTGGVLQSVIDFGTVLIQTAGEVPEIRFKNVPRPDQVEKFLGTLTEKEDIRQGR